MKLPQYGNGDDDGIPAAWFQLFNVITVLVMVPLVDRFIYPRLDRVFERAPHQFRMVVGKILKYIP